MAKIVGVGSQQRQDFLYRADITMTGSAQRVLGASASRSLLLLQNIGSHAMNVEIGAAAAHATLSSGTVSAITVDNVGLGYSMAPIVALLGGGSSNNPGLSSYVGSTQPNTPAPQHPATAHAVMTGSAPNMTISSITVDDPGSGYDIAPYVLIYNHPMDPNGVATVTSSTGLVLPANMTAPIRFDATGCPTEGVSVIGTASDVLICRWMD